MICCHSSPSPDHSTLPPAPFTKYSPTLLPFMGPKLWQKDDDVEGTASTLDNPEPTVKVEPPSPVPLPSSDPSKLLYLYCWYPF